MRKVKQWVIAVIFSLVAFLGVFSWQKLAAQSPADPSSSGTLSSAGLTVEKLAEGVYGLIASNDFPPSDGNQAIANAGFVIGSDGVAVIDTFQNPKFTDLMLATIKTMTEKPVRYVVNTHYHFDHTGGNGAALKKGIVIVGRGPIREFMQTRNRQYDPEISPPEIVINSETELWLGNRSVRIERVEGHSGGTDVVVYVPDAKVLFTGDMVFHERIPYTGDGNIRDWQGSLYRLIATYPDAKVVPGHGVVTDVSGLRAQLSYFNDLERLALSWKAKGLSKQDAIAQSAEIPEAYKNYKFQAIYATNVAGLRSNLDTAYDQFSRSSGIPLIP